jgi:hypothetical protein
MRQRDVPFTREDVVGWLSDYDGKIEDTKKLRKYLAEKLGELANEPIDTAGNDSLGDETLLIHIIIMDLPSYA